MLNINSDSIEGRAKIADFGVSRKIKNDKNEYYASTEAKGTIPFMPPEVLVKEEKKSRKPWDVWSYGLLLLHICQTGVVRDNRVTQMNVAVLAENGELEKLLSGWISEIDDVTIRYVAKKWLSFNPMERITMHKIVCLLQDGENLDSLDDDLRNLLVDTHWRDVLPWKKKKWLSLDDFKIIYSRWLAEKGRMKELEELVRVAHQARLYILNNPRELFFQMQSRLVAGEKYFPHNHHHHHHLFFRGSTVNTEPESDFFYYYHRQSLIKGYIYSIYRDLRSYLWPSWLYDMHVDDVVSRSSCWDSADVDSAGNGHDISIDSTCLTGDRSRVVVGVQAVQDVITVKQVTSDGDHVRCLAVPASFPSSAGSCIEGSTLQVVATAHDHHTWTDYSGRFISRYVTVWDARTCKEICSVNMAEIEIFSVGNSVTMQFKQHIIEVPDGDFISQLAWSPNRKLIACLERCAVQLVDVDRKICASTRFKVPLNSNPPSGRNGIFAVFGSGTPESTSEGKYLINLKFIDDRIILIQTDRGIYKALQLIPKYEHFDFYYSLQQIAVLNQWKSHFDAPKHNNVYCKQNDRSVYCAPNTKTDDDDVPIKLATLPSAVADPQTCTHYNETTGEFIAGMKNGKIVVLDTKDERLERERERR